MKNWSKLSEHNGVTHQNLCERGNNPMEKELSQSGKPFLRKLKKEHFCPYLSADLQPNASLLKNLWWHPCLCSFPSKADCCDDDQMMMLMIQILYGHHLNDQRNCSMLPLARVEWATCAVLLFAASGSYCSCSCKPTNLHFNISYVFYRSQLTFIYICTPLCGPPSFPLICCKSWDLAWAKSQSVN